MNTRRVVLKTIGITSAAGCLASVGGGCGGDGGTSVPTGVSTMCGANMCFNLSENTELQMDGGILFFEQGGRKIYVRRTGDTFVALTAICTHAGCVIDWNGSDGYVCACHGSKFSDTGKVTDGPAVTALKMFGVSQSGDTVTITLA